MRPLNACQSEVAVKMQHTRFGMAFVALVAVGCASSRNTSTPSVVWPTPAAEVADQPSGGSNVYTIKGDEVVFAAPAQRVWTALMEVYDEFKVPLNDADPKNFTIVVSHQRVRRIGGTLVDRYFECGGAFENDASRGDLCLELRSQLEAIGAERTILRTAASSEVKPANQSSTKPCPGNGKIQKVIRARLEAKLGLKAES